MEDFKKPTSVKNFRALGQNSSEQSEARENIIVVWMMWHFYQMPKFLLSVWKNYILFTLDFFSAPLLLVTLFLPWRKYKWRYPRGFDITEYFNTFISNFFSRIIGAVCRFFLIITSVVFLIVVWFAGAAAILIWILIPFIFIVLILLFL